MKIALIHSRMDPGGSNIRHHIDQILLEKEISSYPLTRHELEFHEVSGRLLYEDHLDRELEAELLIFLSRHSSQNPEPVLTVHVTGNPGSAGYGGKPGSLAMASPGWMHAVLKRLSSNAPAGYRVAYEVTHHGPSEIDTPSFFVEIGSTESEWNDPVAGRAAAKSILEAEPGDTIDLIGIGGNHYARRQTEIALASRAAFGHIAHTREVPLIDRSMLMKMIERTRAVAVYIDKKSVPSSDLARMDALISQSGIPRLYESDLLAMKYLSFAIYRQITVLGASIAADARISIPEGLTDGIPVVITISRELLEEAKRADEAALRCGLYQMPLVLISTRKEPIIPSFICTAENPGNILNDLISLCVSIISSAENTAIEGDQLIIMREKFDPGKARELGITAGPLYGELVNGRNVRIGDRMITPDMVRISSERRIHIPGLEKYL